MTKHRQTLEDKVAGQLNAIEGTRQGLEVVSGKWTILVVFALKQEQRRLSDLQRMIEGISQKMLIQTLRKLEWYGLVERTVYPVVPPKVEYALTPFKPYCTRVPLSRYRLSAANKSISSVATYSSAPRSIALSFEPGNAARLSV